MRFGLQHLPFLSDRYRSYDQPPWIDDEEGADTSQQQTTKASTLDDIVNLSMPRQVLESQKYLKCGYIKAYVNKVSKIGTINGDLGVVPVPYKKSSDLGRAHAPHLSLQSMEKPARIDALTFDDAQDAEGQSVDHVILDNAFSRHFYRHALDIIGWHTSRVWAWIPWRRFLMECISM